MSVEQNKVADIMNAINDALEEYNYEAVGYDNTGEMLVVVIEKHLESK